MLKCASFLDSFVFEDLLLEFYGKHERDERNIFEFTEEKLHKCFSMIEKVADLQSKELPHIYCRLKPWKYILQKNICCTAVPSKHITEFLNGFTSFHINISRR